MVTELTPPTPINVMKRWITTNPSRVGKWIPDKVNPGEPLHVVFSDDDVADITIRFRNGDTLDWRRG